MEAGTQPWMSSRVMTQTMNFERKRGMRLNMSMLSVLESTFSLRPAVIWATTLAQMLSMVSPGSKRSFARASAPESLNSFFTTKAAVSSLR